MESLTRELVRLDPCFLCYTPPPHAPDVTGCPAEEVGAVLFLAIGGGVLWMLARAR